MKTGNFIFLATGDGWTKQLLRYVARNTDHNRWTSTKTSRRYDNAFDGFNSIRCQAMQTSSREE